MQKNQKLMYQLQQNQVTRQPSTPKMQAGDDKSPKSRDHHL